MAPVSSWKSELFDNMVMVFDKKTNETAQPKQEHEAKKEYNAVGDDEFSHGKHHFAAQRADKNRYQGKDNAVSIRGGFTWNYYTGLRAEKQPGVFFAFHRYFVAMSRSVAGPGKLIRYEHLFFSALYRLLSQRTR